MNTADSNWFYGNVSYMTFFDNIPVYSFKMATA